MARKIVALVAGVLVVGSVVLTLQQVSAALHPLPEGLDPMDPADAEAFTDHLETMPPSAWAMAFLSELVGAFFGGLAAGWIARDQARPFSGVVVALALVFSVLNWLGFAHPVWFVLGQLMGYPLVLMAVWWTLGAADPATPGAPGIARDPR